MSKPFCRGEMAVGDNLHEMSKPVLRGHFSISCITLDKALFSTKKYLYIVFLFLDENICIRAQGASYEYPQHTCIMFS